MRANALYEGPNECSVRLVWNRVTTDTVTPTPNRLTIDNYYIERERRLASASPITGWESAGTAILSDPNFEGNSMSNTPTVTFTDATAQHHEPVSRERYYYRYRVRATNCSANSGFTGWEDFPDVCSSSTRVESTASSGTGGPGTAAWDMNASDYVFLTPASGVTITRADFQLLHPVTNAAIASSSSTSPPFIFSWITGADPTLVYPLVVTVAQATGCLEEYTVYLQEDPGLCPPTIRNVVGQSSGTGVVASPYVFNAGDRIELTEFDSDSATTLFSIQYSLLDATNAVVDTVTSTTSPFAYTWVARSPGAIYRLRPRVIWTAPACSEDLADIYIKDEVCSGATTTATGFISGSGTSGDPWVMNSGGRIQVDQPVSGNAPQRVTYTVQAVTPAGSAEAPVTQATAPFIFQWTNRTDETVYRVDFLVEYSTGCSETFSRYVKDDPGACKVRVDDPDGTLVRVFNPNPGDPSAELDLVNTGTATYTIKNVAITWNRWDSGITWDSVTVPGAGTYTVNSNNGGNIGEQTINLDFDPRPAGFSADPTITAGGTLTLTLNFTETGNRDPIERGDIRTVCVTYTRADTGTRLYNCRIVSPTAPDAAASNPTSCE
jgi:hypothetical protein